MILLKNSKKKALNQNLFITCSDVKEIFLVGVFCKQAKNLKMQLIFSAYLIAKFALKNSYVLNLIPGAGQ